MKRSPSNSMKRCLPTESASTSRLPSRTAASPAERPVGLCTRTLRPAKAPPNSLARRRRVCPSGIRGFARGRCTQGGLGQGRQFAVVLVGRELGNATLVALLTRERGGQEDLDEP